MDISLNRLNAILGQEKDSFFGPASDLLLRAVEALADTTRYPDLLTCVAILEWRNLASRLEQADLDDSIGQRFDCCFGFGIEASEKTVEFIQSEALSRLRRNVSQLSIAELAHRRAEINRLFPLSESALDSTTESSSRKVVQFDTSEAAERAAWMLKGECINETQVIVPKHNANDLAIGAIASIVGSSWSWVKRF
jgi:hypothetical protein